MKIDLNEILLNSQDRNMKEKIIIFDDNGDFYLFNVLLNPTKHFLSL